MMLQIFFYAIAATGTLLAVIGVFLLVARAVKHRDPDRFTEGLPWGYMGVGLVVSFAGFYSARAITTAEMPVLHDLVGLVVLLLVASAGLGVLYGWSESHLKRPIPWVTPVVISLLMGLLGGFSSVAV